LRSRGRRHHLRPHRGLGIAPWRCGSARRRRLKRGEGRSRRAAGGDDDRVGRIRERHAVGRAKDRRVGQRRIAFHDRKRHAERFELTLGLGSVGELRRDGLIRPLKEYVRDLDCLRAFP